MTLENKSEISISYLPEMLEGQVAILSSGYISGKAALELLDALKSSALFRDEQYSYILYPNKELPRFINKNNIVASKIKDSVLLSQLLADGNTTIIERDIYGDVHFNANFHNVENLIEALYTLPEEKYYEQLLKDKTAILEIFEDIFQHKSFTGRSGTFFGYEGLGSIYWHMVSKLVLSIQEICLFAVENKENAEIIGRLFEHYYEANEGIGIHKSPELYGAFPTDPYSHTPGGKGAQQPGMTGQVKEDILSRFGELGVFVSDGELCFKPVLLRADEFLQEQKSYSYTSINNEIKEIFIGKNSLCFSYCQIPIVYNLCDTEKLQVVFEDRSILEFKTLNLNRSISKKIFERTGEIDHIVVSFKKK